MAQSDPLVDGSTRIHTRITEETTNNTSSTGGIRVGTLELYVEP